MKEEIYYRPAGKVVEDFHGSDAFIKGIMGPVGSSKTSACIMDFFERASTQVPNHRGERWTRWLVLRNTFPELKSTTIKTFQDWFPNARFRWDSPITAWLDFYLPDKTRLRSEWVFLALERPEDVGKLKSFEATGGWLNEAGEMAKAVLDMASQRVGRYPSVRTGGPTWSGIIMDTNPPDDDHWYYKLAEETDSEETRELEKSLEKHGTLKANQPLLGFFKQPGGLILKDGRYEPNPEAENIENLPGGYGYYLRLIVGKTKAWNKVFVLGQYGTTMSGKPVYPEYNDEVHVREVKPHPAKPIVLGFDYGLTPGCAFMQVNHRGQLIIFDELQADDMAIRQFARDVVNPHLSTNYHGYRILSAGDPAGVSRSQTDERSCFQELAEEGLICLPVASNDPIARTGAVRKFLTKMVDGQPGLLLDPKCKILRKGFNGGYCYQRVQIAGPEPRYRDTPAKNNYSHLHDALQYGAMFASTFNLDSQFGKPIVYPKKTGII